MRPPLDVNLPPVFKQMMKKLLFLLLLPLLSAAPHKFYVSKTFVEFNPRTQGYEVMCKLFTDDLERALTAAAQKTIRLGGDTEPSIANDLVEAYLQNHLRISYNNMPMQLRYVGKEVDSDLTICYLEFTQGPDYSTIAIENTIFYEFFPEQQNLLDLIVNGTTKTVIFTKEKPSEVIFR